MAFKVSLRSSKSLFSQSSDLSYHFTSIPPRMPSAIIFRRARPSLQINGQSTWTVRVSKTHTSSGRRGGFSLQNQIELCALLGLVGGLVPESNSDWVLCLLPLPAFYGPTTSPTVPIDSLDTTQSIVARPSTLKHLINKLENENGSQQPQMRTLRWIIYIHFKYFFRFLTTY